MRLLGVKMFKWLHWRDWDSGDYRPHVLGLSAGCFLASFSLSYLIRCTGMKTFSTREVAKKLGIGAMTLSRYIATGKVPKPKSATSGGMTIHFWTEKEIEHIRQLLPKIANGRKTRYQKQRKQQSRRQPKH